MITFNSELTRRCLLRWDLRRVMCLSSALRGGGHFGMQQGLLPHPSFSLLRAPPCDFSVLHHLGRSKRNPGSLFWFFLLTLTKDLLSWSFLTHQSQTAWSWFYPRLWKLFQPSQAQFQIFTPEFCVKINWAAFSSRSPTGEWLPVWEIPARFRS